MKLYLKTAVMPLTAVSVTAFILQLSIKGFTDNFVLVSADVLSRPWILLSSMFLHGGFSHLFFNMYALLMFGPMLEQKIGAKRFIMIYLLSGIAAAIISSFFYKSALGASGAIMGMIGVLIMLMPELRLLFFLVIPMPLWVAGIIWALMDTFGVFFPSGVGNIAHLTGMGLGLLAGIYLRNQKKRFSKGFSSKHHLGEQDIEEYLKSGRL